jgi:hypothetical protein
VDRLFTLLERLEDYRLLQPVVHERVPHAPSGRRLPRAGPRLPGAAALRGPRGSAAAGGGPGAGRRRGGCGPRRRPVSRRVQVLVC